MAFHRSQLLDLAECNILKFQPADPTATKVCTGYAQLGLWLLMQLNNEALADGRRHGAAGHDRWMPPDRVGDVEGTVENRRGPKWTEGWYWLHVGSSAKPSPECEAHCFHGPGTREGSQT